MLLLESDNFLIICLSLELSIFNMNKRLV